MCAGSLLAAGLWVLLSSHAQDAAPSVPAVAKAPLPPSLVEVLAADFPGLVPAEREFFHPDVAVLVGDEHPGRAVGDFNGDDLADVALLLVDDERQVVAVFLRLRDDAWEVHPLERREGREPRGYLATLPPGRHELAAPSATAGEAPTMELLHDALELGVVGETAALTFWTQGRAVTHPRQARRLPEGAAR